MGRGVISGVREPTKSLSSPDSGADLEGSTAVGTVSRALPGDLTAVGEARSVVQRVLSSWRAEAIFDDVVLVASELVANALRHGVCLDGARGQADREDVRISLVSTGSHVICAVTDPSEEPPVRMSADPLAASGRGLQLVESLSLCWGWTLLDDDREGPSLNPVHGKSVWAIFPLNRARPARVVGAA